MIAAFIFFRIFESCKSRTGAAEPGAGADFACTLPGLPVRAGIYCEAKIIQAAPTAKFIWRLWPCGLFSGEIGARTAYLRPVLFCCPPPPCPVSSARRVSALLCHVLFPRHAESLPSSAMSCFLGTPSLCPPPPCPFPSARRFSLAPSRPSDYLLPAPASFPAPAFSRNPPGIHPTHDRLLSSASALPRYSLSWHPPRPRPSRPFSSLLVPSCPVSSLLCIPCFRPRPCRSFFWEAGDFGMKMRNTSLFGK